LKEVFVINKFVKLGKSLGIVIPAEISKKIENRYGPFVVVVKRIKKEELEEILEKMTGESNDKTQ